MNERNNRAFAARRCAVSITAAALLAACSGSGDGSGPVAAPIDVKGMLYGTTVFGGAGNHGTVYSLTGI